MVFVGYEEGSKAYRVYNPSTQRVYVSRDDGTGKLGQVRQSIKVSSQSFTIMILRVQQLVVRGKLMQVRLREKLALLQLDLQREV
jgi:hypothetical protein